MGEVWLSYKSRSKDPSFKSDATFLCSEHLGLPLVGLPWLRQSVLSTSCPVAERDTFKEPQDDRKAFQAHPEARAHMFFLLPRFELHIGINSE